jgi:hypothetical protein
VSVTNPVYSSCKRVSIMWLQVEELLCIIMSVFKQRKDIIGCQYIQGARSLNDEHAHIIVLGHDMENSPHC